MYRAIAAGRRLCQALLLVVLLSPSLAAAQDEDPPVTKDVSSFVILNREGLSVSVACPPVTAPARTDVFCGALANQTSDVIKWFSNLLGPSPRKYVQLKYASISGRVAEQKVTASPGEIIAAPGMAAAAGTGLGFYDFLPREIGRQWFLGGESERNEASRLLAEGLPEYLSWRYLREVNAGAARALVAEAMRDLAAEGVGASVSAFAGGSGDGINPRVVAARARGLLVFRTLETVIDRERVDRVLPEIVHRYHDRPFAVGDFQKVCEEVSGRDLKWFFQYFFEQGGIPEIELLRLPSESPNIVAGKIVVHGLPSEGSVRVEMAVRTAQGTIEHSVATRGEVTPFTANVPAPALDIVLDPDQRILRWTEAARRSQAQSKILAALPNPITHNNVADAIAIYRRALEADPEDISLRGQSLHERLGELEWAHDEWSAALADLEAAINGHSIAPFETYLTRGKAYLYHGVVSGHEGRPKEAFADAIAGLAMPRPVLLAVLPGKPIESRSEMTLQQLLETLQQAATHD